MEEIWKDINGYEGHYQVSNRGNVRSLNHLNKKGYIKNLKLCKLKIGYMVVNLNLHNKSNLTYVHRLVAEAFIPNPENKPQVNHIDGDKANNDLSNLEWVTASENQFHAIRTGLKKDNNIGKTGYLCKNSKPIDQFTKDGVFIQRWGSACDAARHYGYRQGNIWRCLHGGTPKAYGYIWKFADKES